MLAVDAGRLHSLLSHDVADRWTCRNHAAWPQFYFKLRVPRTIFVSLSFVVHEARNIGLSERMGKRANMYESSVTKNSETNNVYDKKQRAIESVARFVFT